MLIFDFLSLFSMTSDIKTFSFILFFFFWGGGSCVGDLTLIFIFFGLPTYFLSLFTTPTVANRLEKLWDFLKSWLGDEFKFLLVHWNLICFHSVMGF